MFDKRNDLVTVFGGGGFIGRYVCEALFKSGIRVRVADRHPRRAYFLQPLAAIGQLDLVAADIGRRPSVARAVEGASSVINLVGILKGDFEALQAEGAGTVAEEAGRAGAKALVHVSADVLRRYTRRKAVAAQLDYEDLILKTVDLLQRPGIAPWVLY
jgi:NADH dehydrogenase